MEEIQKTKSEIRSDIASEIEQLSKGDITDKTKEIERRLFEFANFMESKITLLYTNNTHEVVTSGIIRKCFDFNKIVVLPMLDSDTHKIKLLKIDDINKDIKYGLNDEFELVSDRCKLVPVDRIDIAIIPGLAFDEKGGRIGTGDGYYDRLIPKLPITTRKVALAYEEQILQQVPVESYDKHVDIIITDKRVIYKI